jgi:uncharacterized protein DUF1629
MEYYELFIDNSFHTPYWQLAIDEKLLEMRGGDIWSYSRGEKCAETPVPCRIRLNGEPADYNQDALTTAPIVSSRLAELLFDIAHDDIQLVRVQMEAPGDWSVVNVTSIINAIDYTKSVMTFHDADHPRKPGKPSGIARLIVNKELIGGHHMFRLGEYKTTIIVSASIKERCQNALMTRMKFIPTNMTDWMRYLANPHTEEWCYHPWRVIAN